MNYKYSHCVYIGRFQPFHLGHLYTVEKALQLSEVVIIFLGSHQVAPNIKNPWSSEHRQSMISGCFDAATRDRIIFAYVRDRLYSDNLWVSDIQKQVEMITDASDHVAIIGHQKDNSSYYLDLFPQWDYVPIDNYQALNATEIRTRYFSSGDDWKQASQLPSSIIEDLKTFQSDPEYQRLSEEWRFIQQYKASWSVAPYPPTHVTVDAVVVQSGHVLMVRRKASPGKGLVALPGGFINALETLEQAMLRELKEETGIKVPAPVLKGSIVGRQVFDNPDRSQRGRTITHAFFIQLKSGPLPRVKGSDDANKAWWMSLSSLEKNEPRFYEDHFHIIQHFISQI
ncbi:MAG: bifunctional nicotinamide-nucleotide adenylyltransferase/Nudix hydroxylase [Thermosynechococcaceae cyanobacterium]